MIERLEASLDYVAACIAAGDESLLPLFERLDRELTLRQSKHQLIAKAKARLARVPETV